LILSVESRTAMNVSIGTVVQNYCLILNEPDSLADTYTCKGRLCDSK
jgi:hypothetical protein